MNYTYLRDLLAAGKWEEANKETARAMVIAVKRENLGWLSDEDIESFSCEDLRMIDQLWLSASKGKFGFSVQQKIYESLGGTREVSYEVRNKFGYRVGWTTKEGTWLWYRDLIFNAVKAPKAHLPVGLVSVGTGRGDVFSLGGGRLVDDWLSWTHNILSRAKACNL